MYGKVVVPLDGSQLSECSLDHMEAIAMGCNVPEVVLLRVVEPLNAYELGPLADVGGEAVIKLENERKDEAAAYIYTLRKSNQAVTQE
jgi:Universal stress protein family